MTAEKLDIEAERVRFANALPWAKTEIAYDGGPFKCKQAESDFRIWLAEKQDKGVEGERKTL